MAGLVPAIHVMPSLNSWMPGTGPGMTKRWEWVPKGAPAFREA
jgi:hypothetical protein